MRGVVFGLLHPDGHARGVKSATHCADELAWPVSRLGDAFFQE
jgi:hypothetical protein